MEKVGLMVPLAPIKKIKISKTVGNKKKRKSLSERKKTTINSDEHQPELLADDETQNENQRQQPKTSVVIAGDSIIKYVKG